MLHGPYDSDGTGRSHVALGAALLTWLVLGSAVVIVKTSRFTVSNLRQDEHRHRPLLVGPELADDLKSFF